MSNKTNNWLIGILVVLGLLGLVVILSLVTSQETLMPSRADIREVSNSLVDNSLINDVDMAYQIREYGAFLLDVRTIEEWNEAYIPGAFLIPLDDLQVRIEELPEDQVSNLL